MLNRTYLMALTGIASVLSFGSMSADTNHDASKTEQTSAQADNDNADMIKLSEAFGHFIGRNLNSPGMKFDLEAIIKGMRNGAAGNPAPMADQEYEALLMKMQEKAFKQISDANLKAANEFLETNKSKPDVKEIEPGKLQYTILQEGTGQAVEEHNAPQIHYVGKYIDGTTFSSSQDAGGPVTLPLDQTIPGFSKGLLGMKEGEKRRLFVHPDLAYGTMGQLPPNSLLIFDIEVIKANNKDANQSNLDSDGDDLRSLSGLGSSEDESEEESED